MIHGMCVFCRDKEESKQLPDAKAMEIKHDYIPGKFDKPSFIPKADRQ